MIRFYILSILLLPAVFSFTQSAVDGYVVEANNRGFLNQATVNIYQLPENYVRGELMTNEEGHFSIPLPPGTYRFVTKKDLFYTKMDTFEIGETKTFVKVVMQRRPGYLFDATIAESRTEPTQVVDGVSGARVEIYNRTQRRPELVLLDHPNAFFQFTFEQGNHYTIMIRKPGFIAKRIEARVNVEGCIICVDGVRELNPGITENLTAGNKMGTLLSNIELDRMKLDKRIAIRNIYYDYDKWDIRPDAAKQLNKVVELMNDNPGLSVELGSHTDSRGPDEYNETLSQKRAEAAVEYIIEHGVAADRITAKGYGESQLSNRCRNGVNCSEAEHQENRRTELRITGITTDSLEILQWKSLDDIIRAEEFEEDLKKISNGQTVRVRAPAPNGANTSESLPTFNPGSPTAVNLPKAFTAYTIELAQQNEAIDLNQAIFYKFSPVFLQKTKSKKYFYYGGEFKTPEEAQTAIQKLKDEYPLLKVVRFKNGIRM